MKKLTLLSLFLVFSEIGFNACSSGNAETSAVNSENITFYNVPLVCTAAPEIGCGSRTKPVLLEMEKSSAVKEAWLNRAGTVYAIVWADADKTEEIAKPIFEKYSIGFKKLDESKVKELLAYFRENEKWYRGAEVDKLSIEEAGIIAKDAVTYALNEKLINEKEGDTIKTEIENFLKTELVKTRTTDELNSNEVTRKFRNHLSEVVTKIVGKERAAKITELYWQTNPLEKINDKPCCEKENEKCGDKSEQKSCCNKKQ